MNRRKNTRKNNTRRRYDATPSHYQRRYTEIQKVKYPIILSMLSLSPGDVLLDWGCGTGLLIDSLKTETLSYLGLDFSTGMVSLLKKRHPECEVVIGDCEKIPFRSGYFDVVIGATVIQNLPRPDLGLKEVARVLKPGGQAVITYPRSTGMDLSSACGKDLQLIRKLNCDEDMAISLIKIAR